MTRKARLWQAAALMPLLAIGACSHAIRLPPELETAERLPVEARGGLTSAREIRFGGYEAADIRRSWARGSGVSVGLGRGGGSRGRATASYEYRFRAGDEEGERVGCEAVSSRQAVGMGSVEVEAGSRFDVSCAGAGADGWRLALRAVRNAQPAGTLRAGDASYEVQGVGSGGGLVVASTHGFEIRKGGRAVAAVQKGSPASVWLSPDLPEPDRAIVASAAAALLLLQRIQAD